MRFIDNAVGTFFGPPCIYAIPLDGFDEGISRAIGFIVGKGKLECLGQPGEDRVMIDSVVWAQYINMTDTQTATWH